VGYCLLAIAAILFYWMTRHANFDFDTATWVVWANSQFATVFYYPPFARRAKGEVFGLLYVCLFVRSTISQQPAGRFTPYFACGRSLGRDVSSPLLGVGGPRRAEKEANEISVTMGVNGEFLHFGGF